MTTLMVLALVGLTPDPVVDPDYRPKAGDRAVLAFFFAGIVDGPRPLKAALPAAGYASLEDLRWLHESFDDPALFKSRAGRPVAATEFRPGTEVLVRKVLDFEYGTEGAKHAYQVVLARIVGGSSAGKEYYFDADSVVRLVRGPGPAPTGALPATKFAPPKAKKRRYASQEAQRRQNIEMINQMGGAAASAEAARIDGIRRSMTPGGGEPGGASHYCGAPTLDGTPCMRLVRGYGYCYQHR